MARPWDANLSESAIRSARLTSPALFALGGLDAWVGQTTGDYLGVSTGLKLVEADNRQGGHRSLAAAALAGRAKILDLQQRNASESVRRALYALAAEYTTIAAWACIDLRDLDTAQAYLHESTTFAGLSRRRRRRSSCAAGAHPPT